MSAKHTPGPWSPSGSMRCDTPDRSGRDDMMDFSTGIDCFAPLTENEFGNFERVEEQGVARAYGRTPDEARANARLIAAAPDLLEALELCLHAVKLAGWEGDYSAQKARAAIAKATGEQA